MVKHDKKIIEDEQRDLSILLLQKVVQINKTIPLEIGQFCDMGEHAVHAYIKNNKSLNRLYYIFHKECTDKYYIRFDLPNNKIIRIGDAYSFWGNTDKGVFFRDEEHGYNYLSALHFFTLSSGFKYLTGFKKRTAEAKQTIDYLMTLKSNPNLEGTFAWPKERMNLFPYLDTILSKTK